MSSFGFPFFHQYFFILICLNKSSFIYVYRYFKVSLSLVTRFTLCIHNLQLLGATYIIFNKQIMIDSHLIC